ncbi:dTDP-4-dehydrorhamnose 3,5-epimerase [Anaerotignum lactatifermentans]|uniref:dTDP-4-dehydrorhamnose 3,5-epimerase n=1 Tax=Anaerotignum lactatifermentans TaxID=160404 RepID=A0ABS2GD40_9FIRM|nr:dTDP-4-dehydrorhamnose 3,5-epimerase [Anaerotignum lactatifermentans]MBM6828645.1 dTDP-4-dehydrorhamnose 3,5-epimerase [Anaerotignum lactatifermentans]MBM6878563.1 dTDP-4-dehydrorhamnose 3,5-epimerase [Anaerotignum lactatifermentans]MBM6950227.1 dTDP-4-dehydrorhamnose 3,5-epimerase [Anaerotignum lactatifermentans]
MGQLKTEPLGLEGMRVITPFFQEDLRGSFCKVFRRELFSELGAAEEFSEMFFTRSQRSVLRGLHFQWSRPQWKIVTVLEGEIFDVGVDLRRDSPAYGQWRGISLSAENKKVLYLPAGFAHGFLVRSEQALVAYLCGGDYDPAADGGIRWDDPAIGVAWPFRPGECPVLSPKDAALPTLAEYEERRRRG